MTYGEKGRRTKPRVNVLRGYPGNESTSYTRSAKPKLNEGIKSGQVISLDTNGQWILGCAQGHMPYIAFHDQSDPDVDSCGLLLGLSCAGDFVIETGYFDTTDTIAIDDPLIAGVSTLKGSLDKGTALYAETAAGSLAAIDILGFAQQGKQQVQAGTLTGGNRVRPSSMTRPKTSTPRRRSVRNIR